MWPNIYILILFFSAVWGGGLTEKPVDMTNDHSEAINILGTALEICCTDPVTGFYRDGKCNTGPDDYGTHVVCARMTKAFLDYTLRQGNDLCTARPEYRFPGLKPGDKWCLCAVRWKEALEAGVAPEIYPEATHEKTLSIIPKEILLAKAVK
jgi:uncharacterized protein (DUF2237 family)